MITLEHLVEQLSGKGFRITLARRAILEFFVHANGPTDIEQIVEFLESKQLHPNKTTVYREVSFLLSKGILIELDFSEGKKRYELAGHGHHHHLICTGCSAIEGVSFSEEDLSIQEKQFLERRGFKVTRHMLEFFGLCKSCVIAEKQAHRE